MCNSNFKKKLPLHVSHVAEKLSKRPGAGLPVARIFLLLPPLLLAIVFVTQVEGGFPHKRISQKSRIEGPVVPAPKNWGYRPTRWVRWETDIIHPSLGPIAPDAKKEVKAPEQTDSNGTESVAGTESENSSVPPESTREGGLPSTNPGADGAEMLPPLPPDDGPPATPSNLNEDLPPLPGEDFKPSADKQSPAIENQRPKSNGLSDTPSFRDPDAIFDKTNENKSPQAPPQNLPPLPESTSPSAKTNPPPIEPLSPEPLPPGSSPTNPGEKPNNPVQSPDEEPQWEKRTREKPVDPQDIEKQAPKKKRGEPFYDPDSIFDDRATRTPAPEKVRWQKAGTVNQSSTDRHNAISASSASSARDSITLPSRESVFSPIKPAKRTPSSIRHLQRSEPNTAATRATPSTTVATPQFPFEIEQPQRIRSQGATWRPAKSSIPESKPQTTIQHSAQQDSLVRPVSFEEPIRSQQPKTKQSPVPATARTINTQGADPRKLIRPPVLHSHTESTKNRPTATPLPLVKRSPKKVLASKETIQNQKMAFDQAGRKPVDAQPSRNPIRNAFAQKPSKNSSDENPLRETRKSPFKSPASDVSNPLR